MIHPEQQWGRADETFVVAEELERFGEGRRFSLGHRDLATHIYRTKRLREGEPLSAVTAEITRAVGLEVRLLPATDDPVETRVTTVDGRDLHFQEYWVDERAAPPVAEVRLAGAEAATPAPGVLAAIAGATSLLVCPSNPVVSIGTILTVPGMRAAVAASPAPWSASPPSSVAGSSTGWPTSCSRRSAHRCRHSAWHASTPTSSPAGSSTNVTRR